MAQKPYSNGSGRRKCPSWIDAFVEYTESLESPPLYRKWTAIATIASILERKVWIDASGVLYPNLYVFLVGDPGIGKSRSISTANAIMREVEGIHIGATSMTMAAMVDLMSEAKRVFMRMPEGALEYRALHIRTDELSAFLNEYDKDLIPGLTTFFDCGHYAQHRRVGNIRIDIKSPCLNILTGTTPSNLVKLIPEYAWDQGFTSRCILIYSKERPVLDTFNQPRMEKPLNLIHDLKLMDSLLGECGWTKAYAKAMHDWKQLGYPPVPTHPKLEHYCSRRFSHLIKLSMVANVDRCGDLQLDVPDFNKAMGWLLEAEVFMPNIFSSTSGGAESKAMDEIMFFVRQFPEGVSEHRIINFARTRIEFATRVPDLLKLMEGSGMLRAVRYDKTTQMKIYIATAA